MNSDNSHKKNIYTKNFENIVIIVQKNIYKKVAFFTDICYNALECRIMGKNAFNSAKQILYVLLNR